MSPLTKILLTFKIIKNIHIFLLEYFRILHFDVEYLIRGKRIKKIIARGGSNDWKEIVVVMSGYHYRLDILPPINNPVIFDIGAHIGSFSLFAFDYYKFTNPLLYIFEPDKENFEYLKKNLEINNISPNEYVLHNYAIGDYDGVAKLDKSEQTDAYTIATNPKGKYDTCTIRTLSGIASEEGVKDIDILKLNIEGGEYMLLGHQPTLDFIKNRVLFIIMSYHYVDIEKNGAWIKNRLRDHFDIIFERNDFLIFKNRKKDFSIAGKQGIKKEELLKKIKELSEKHNKQWLTGLEPRKLEERRFHDRYRNQNNLSNISEDSYRKFYGNKKFYTTIQLSTDYVKEWLQRYARGKIFLDYACGNGLNAIRVAKAGAELAIGIDISDISVRNARELARQEGISDNTYFFQGDCENTGLPDNCIDLAVCSGMLHHLDLSCALFELRRILRPGGIVLVIEAIDYNPLIRLYRNITPQMRTEWEKNHILSYRDINFAKRFFDVRNIRHWHLCSVVGAYVPYALPFLNAIDRILLRIPALKKMSWMATFEMHKR